MTLKKRKGAVLSSIAYKTACIKNNIRVQKHRAYFKDDGGKIIQVRLTPKSAKLFKELQEKFALRYKSDLICMALEALEICPDDDVFKLLTMTEDEIFASKKEKIRKDKRRKSR